MKRADDICAPYLPGTRPSQDAAAALPSVCRRFGFVADDPESAAGALHVACSVEQLEALNRYVWEAGERDGDYLDHQGESELAVRAGIACFGSRHPATLAALHNLANGFDAAGRLRESRDVFAFVLDGRRRSLGDDDPETLVTQNDLGLVEQACGDTASARALHEDTLARRRRVRGPTHRETLSSMNNLAVALRGLGENRAALELLEAVLDAREARLGATHRETLMAINNVAACRVERGELAVARDLFSRAWRGFEAVCGENHRDTLTALHNLAWCHQALGERRVADSMYRQLVDRCRLSLGPNHPDTLASERNLARFLLGGDTAPDAVGIIEKVWHAQSAVLGDTHEDTLRSLQLLVELRRGACSPDTGELAARFLDGVGQAARTTGAWPGLVAEAAGFLDDIDRAPATLSVELRDLSTGLAEAWDLAPSDKRSRFADEFRAFHRRWLSWSITQCPTDIPVVLSAMHGREVNALMQANWDERQGVPGDDKPTARWIALRRELIDLRVQLAWCGDPKTRTSIEARHDERLTAYRALRDSLTRTRRDAIGAAAKPLGVDTLRRDLPADEAIALLFLDADTPDEGRGYCALIDRHRLDVIALPGLSDCARLAERAAGDFALHGQRRIVGAEERADDDPPSADELGDTMTKALWQPVADRLDAAVRCVHVVTHDTLHGLPVHVGHPWRLTVFGYPGVVFFAGARSRSDSDAAPTVPPNPSIAVHCDGAVASAAIPFVVADVAIVEQVWPTLSARRPESFSGTEARAQFESGARRFDVWHFACHGAEVAEPRRQTVLSLGDDVQLDATTVVAGRQSPTLAVLGACVVGRVRETRTGEPLGILSGLFAAGADYVVAPVHPVPDFWMPVFLALFYQALAAGGDPSMALTEARRRFESGDWYDNTEHLLASAFAVALERWVPAAAADPAVAAVADAWFLPPDVAHELTGVGASGRLAKFARKPALLGSTASRIAAHLVANRTAIPIAVRRHFGLWVRGFGRPLVRTGTPA